MTLPGQRYFEGDLIYGDWFPRQGDSAVFRAEAIDSNGTGPELTIKFYTKNSDDPGDGAQTTGGESIVLGTTKEIREAIVISNTKPVPGGLDELIRYQCSMIDEGSGAWILARIFPPVFFDTADGSTT